MGKFKDELHGCCVTRFIGLRPKLYSFEFIDKDGNICGKNTAKGVQKAMKEHLSFSDYERCLREMTTKTVSVNSIRSNKHKMFTYNIRKIGLSGFDDKRYFCDDGVKTLAHGHYNAK